MNGTKLPEAERYLKDLERELADLPGSRRREIVGDIREHIEEAAAERGEEAQIRTILEELGDPETIAAEARERFGITRTKATAAEGFAIVLLLVGAVVIPGVGWIIGAVLLWTSRVWTLRHKLIGTFLVPGGLALAFYFGIFATGGSSGCSTPLRKGQVPTGQRGVVCESEVIGPDVWWTILLVFLVVAPIVTAIYLGRRAFRTHNP